MRPVFTRAIICFLLLLSLLTCTYLFQPDSKGIMPKAHAVGPMKIMPLGDSITGSPGCWRALLWQQLQNAGYTNIDFVGTLPAQGCGIAHDGDNEGHGGFLATNIANQNQLPPWLAATTPDIVLMHLGTNDVWSHLSTSTILSAFTTLISQMRASNPNMKILVAQIIPMNPSSCSDCAQGVVNLNAALPNWASSLSTTQSPILLVDQWTGFSTSTDTTDGVHPNDSGIQKIANKWYPPLTSQLGSTPTPTSTNTPTPTPTTGTAACKVTLTSNTWPGGASINIVLQNTGNTTFGPGWTLTFTFNGSITQGWSGTYTQTGNQISVTSPPWNPELAPGESQSLGFNATWSGTFIPPSDFKLNGVPCTLA